MVARRRIPILIALASMVTAAAAAIPATTANAASPTPYPTATTPAAYTASTPPKPPPLAPGTVAGPVRSLPAPDPAGLPAGVKALGLVQPGHILPESAIQQSSVSPDVTQEGPYLIQPYTDIYDAADAYHQNNPTYAWLYSQNDTAAQQWYEAGAYNIDGYVGSAIYAKYDGQDMCMNVKGSVYNKGTQIWVSACSGGVQLNELWEFFAWNVNGVTMYTICASFDTGLCINVKGGIATGNPLIIWDLDQLWDNSLWQFYTA